MAKKRSKPNAELSAKAVAKAEISAKASYQHKKTVSEVIPPDVTRAKASAWLDLLSPITQWAGLKGDALRHQRDLLRIQQDETIYLVAQSIRSKLGDKKVTPVPLKILVPALEKASLEDPADSLMIELWASLLASASSGHKVEPRYVGIISELSATQADCLSRLARHRIEKLDESYIFLKYHSFELSERNVRRHLDEIIRPFLNDDHFSEEERWPILRKALLDWIEDFDGPGVYLMGFMFGDVDHNMKQGEGLDIKEKDILILESLGLIRREAIFLNYDEAVEGGPVGGFAEYLYLTGLGIDFMELCDADIANHLKGSAGAV